jgi:2-hydroxychromene-2-carboxylate isomerase
MMRAARCDLGPEERRAMTLKTRLMAAAAGFITSRSRRRLRAGLQAWKRRLVGGRPILGYFHDAGDPYSQLAAQMLAPLLARYDIELKVWPVSPPGEAAAPDHQRLAAYALRDAPRVAAAYGLRYPDNTQPRFTATLEEGDRERARLGHYLSGMFHFEGEWFWGVDRLSYLEERLAALGLDRRPGEPPLAPWRDITLAPVAKPKVPPVIELWFSFRSPYSWLVMPRIRRLAAHYGAELKLRPVLPMVMRGLPVPGDKRLYIVLDCKREAERLGLPFGRIVDPVGAGVERALAVLHHAGGADFAQRALRAAFAHGRALADDGDFYAIAREASLTDAQVTAALADDSWRAAAEENRQALLDAGLWGVPAFRVNGGPAHWGQDRLWALEEDLRPK